MTDLLLENNASGQTSIAIKKHEPVKCGLNPEIHKSSSHFQTLFLVRSTSLLPSPSTPTLSKAFLLDFRAKIYSYLQSFRFLLLSLPIPSSLTSSSTSSLSLSLYIYINKHICSQRYTKIDITSSNEQLPASQDTLRSLQSVVRCMQLRVCKSY